MITRLANQPYLLLSLTSLFWAGNIVLGRFVSHHIPPITLSAVRYAGACLVVLPFAWPYLRRDWPAIRGRLPLLTMLALSGFALNNVLSYWGLQYTEAVNAMLIQSSTPLFVALWALALFGIRLTGAQGLGVMLSLIGIFVILLRGDLTTLSAITFNTGDIMIIASVIIFAVYSVIVTRRPAIHPLSLICFLSGLGGLIMSPGIVWEISVGRTLTFDALTLLTLSYVMVFPTTLAYLCFNRGVELIGANRSAPFIHLVPVFGSVLAILFLGERLQLFHLIGYALVLAGIAFASRKSRSPAA